MDSKCCASWHSFILLYLWKRSRTLSTRNTWLVQKVELERTKGLTAYKSTYLCVCIPTDRLKVKVVFLASFTGSWAIAVYCTFTSQVLDFCVKLVHNLGVYVRVQRSQNEGFCSRGYSGSLEYRFGDGLDGSMEIDPPIMPDINGTVHRLTLTQAHILENARYSGSIVSDGLMIEVKFCEFHYK